MDEAIELLTRVLCDMRPPAPADAAYLYCQTAGNAPSLFVTARELIADCSARKILILHSDAKSGYPGYPQWKQQLLGAGLSEAHIEGVEIQETAVIQTLIESEALIRHAWRKQFASLVVVASPFQQLRAFMTAVTVAVRLYPGLAVYSRPGRALPWQDQVLHSQGTLKAKRSELIGAELERIAGYQKKGHLAPFEQVLTYLTARD
jgi:hypothetical protein